MSAVEVQVVSEPQQQCRKKIKLEAEEYTSVDCQMDEVKRQIIAHQEQLHKLIVRMNIENGLLARELEVVKIVVTLQELQIIKLLELYDDAMKEVATEKALNSLLILNNEIQEFAQRDKGLSFEDREE